MKRRTFKKESVPDYGIDKEDDVADMNLGDLFHQPHIPPQNEKQILPKPPTYELSFKDVLEGEKQIYVDPQNFPEKESELPPAYCDEEIDCGLADEYNDNMILDDLGLSSYDDVEMQLNDPQMTPQKTNSYLKRKIKDAKTIKKQFKGYKSGV